MSLSTIHAECLLELEQLSRLLDQRVAGMKINESLEIERMQLSGSQEWLYADIDTIGMYTGGIRAKFKLDFDAKQFRFVLPGLQLQLAEQKGLFAKGANWFMKNVLGEKLDRQFEEMFNSQFHAVFGMAAARAKNVDLKNGLFLLSEVKSISFEQIRWDTHSLRCNAILHGSVSIRLTTA